MEHSPADYNCVINFNFQQLMEVSKAITDRQVALSIRPDYDYKEQDLDALISIGDIIGEHIQLAVEAWEQKVVNVESQDLNNDEKFRKFLSDE